MKNCIHCGGDNLRKHGKNKNNIRWYYCKDCNKYFNKDSDPKRGLIVGDKKYCKACNSFKLLSEFFYYNGKPRSICKLCHSIKNNSRFSKYHINQEYFKIMLDSQKNKCAICNNKFKSNRTIFIDHNHKTNKIRKLLCPKCNYLLGCCNDNINILKSAILYLKNN
jgi:transposase-like protein